MAGPIVNVNTAVAPSANSSAYAKVYGVQPEYQVVLDVTGDTSLLTGTGTKIFPIIANLPERFNMELTSSWESPFARTSVGDLGSAISGGKVSADTLNAALGATGIGKTTKAQTFQVWQESSPMLFNIEMVFHATTNSVTDIRDKHRALLKLCAPGEAGPLLIPPGPNLRSDLTSKDNSRQITLYIGRYLKLQNVVIKSVSSDVSALFDKAGIPQSMTISLSVESFYSCFTGNDLDKMFMV